MDFTFTVLLKLFGCCVLCFWGIFLILIGIEPISEGYEDETGFHYGSPKIKSSKDEADKNEAA